MENYATIQAQNFPFNDVSWDLVSIYGCGEEALLTDEVKSVFKERGCRNFLSLDFWDVTEKSHKKSLDTFPDSILFNEEHAKQVVDFIKNVQKEDKDSFLLAHCSAGISRSGAIGTFACEFCGLDYAEFITDNSYIMANPHILRLLRREAGMTPSFGTHDGIAPMENKEGVLIPSWFGVENEK